MELWILSSINLYTIYKVKKSLKDYVDITQEERMIIKTLHVYPLIQIFTWSVSTVNIIYKISNNDQSNWFNSLSIIFMGTQGLLDAFVYAFTPGIKKNISELIYSIFGNKKIINEEMYPKKQFEIQNISNQTEDSSIDLSIA